MKLLLENWRKYLTEGEAQHFPWLKEIQATDDLKEIQAIVESDRFIRIGRGSFRSVYKPVGDPEYVIKVIHDSDDYKMQMNKDDFETAKRYPFIFPKAYAHADDFSWIVMEKTRPISWPSQMQKVLDQSFPKEQEALLKVADELGEQFNPADPFHIMGRLMDSFRADREVALRNVSDDPSDADRKALELQKIIAPVAGAAYQELSKAMHEFEIDKYEINRSNIGHDDDYNFKIIDSSVFSSKWDEDDDLKEGISEAADTEPDLIKFSEELNQMISSLLLRPESIEHLNQQTAGGEAITILDTGALFANYETINEVHLGVAINDRGEASIKAFYLCVPEDRSQSNLVITLNIPRGYEEIETFEEWLTEELEDALSHELQHSCDPTDMLTGDIPEGEEKWDSLENIYKHFASEAETRGHLAGARGRARRTGGDIERIVANKINLIFNDAIERGYNTSELQPVMQAIWEKWTNYLHGWNV